MKRKLDLEIQRLIPEPARAPVIAAIEASAPGCRLLSVSTSSRTNDLMELRFEDGRTLMVKRARHPWARERFAAARAAAGLLREAGIPAPKPLEVPTPADELPLEIYWKIDGPTLEEAWGAADGRRRTLIRDWGKLVRRIHRIELPGYGPLLRPHPGGLGGYLRDDLAERLLPAVAGAWPEARGTVEAVCELAERVAGWIGDAPATLVHNDLHVSNVLCSPDGAACVGVLDLETAVAAPPEAEIARAEVLHGPLFGTPLPPGWLDEFMRGYGRGLDRAAVAFFRAWHLLDLGFHATLCGWEEHAGEVLEAARRSVDSIRRRGLAAAVGQGAV